MKDLTERLEDLAVDAAECDLIANLTVDTEKRELFKKLARQYRLMAAEVRAELDRRIRIELNPPDHPNPDNDPLPPGVRSIR